MDILRLHAGKRWVAEVDLDVGPARYPERGRALVGAEAQERGDGHDVALAGTAAGDPLEVAQLLERVDAHIRVGADADADTPRAERFHRREAVAEVGLSGRAKAHAGT